MHVPSGTGGADKDCPQNQGVTHRHYLHVDQRSLTVALKTGKEQAVDRDGQRNLPGLKLAARDIYPQGSVHSVSFLAASLRQINGLFLNLGFLL